MIRAVLDTNIFISALFWKGAPYDILQAGLEGRFTIVTSEDILMELEGRLKHKFHFPERDTNEFLEIIALNAYIVTPNHHVMVVRADPTDNKILECAIAGESHFVVSGDRHLLDLCEYGGVKIVNAHAFLSVV